MEIEKMGVFPDFFFDIISRLVPGIILLYPYHFNYINQKLSIQAIIVGLTFAYVLGFILNIIGGPIWSVLFRRHALLSRLFKPNAYYRGDEIWKNKRKNILAIQRKLMVKVRAEFILFRSLTLLPPIFIVIKPPALTISITQLLLSFLLFCFCMIYTYRTACSSFDEYRE